MMLNSFWKFVGQDPAKLVRSFIFFAIFYLYLWLGVDFRLIYHGGGVITNFPVFFRGWDFFHQFMLYPGGFVEYFSAFLSQFFYYSPLGSLIVTLQAWLFFICVVYFFKAINAPRLCWLRFVPPILLLITYNQYTYYFVTTMALLTAFVFVCLYLKLSSRNSFVRSFVFITFSLVLYTIAGGPYLYFAVLCAIYELFFKRRCWLSLLYLLLAIVIPFMIGVFAFGVSTIDAFSKLMPFSWEILFDRGTRRMVTVVYILYLLVPFALILLGFWRVIPERFKFSSSGKAIFSWYSRKKKFRYLVESLALFVITVAVIFYSHNKGCKTFIEVNYYSCYNMWPQTLAAARRHRSNNFYVVHAVNRALYHSGRLACDMFSYPQSINSLFPPSKGTTEGYWQKFDTYIDLGFISRAEHILTTAVDEFGRHPILLKRLALINIIKGDTATARIYLNTLSKTLFDADWADKYLDILANAPNSPENSRIQYLSRSMTQTDYANISFVNEESVLDLLAENNHNRMAFEYLMAGHLLANRLDKFLKDFDRAKDFNYFQTPRLYEQALILCRLNNIKDSKLNTYQISAETHRTVTGFLTIYERHNKNKRTALNELKNGYGDSYLFYYLYGLTGAER